jgi:L-threonylcarbamoyladenylate synthase
MLITKLIKVNHLEPESAIIAEAAEVLKRGGLVAFPTETVYGLGADALNAEAVARIFQVKGRPTDVPVIVHIAEPIQLSGLTEGISPIAKLLMEKFWPGPLTLLFPKSDLLPDIVTAGQATVAVRMPKNQVALALIKTFGSPIAAPSANLSGRPSGTTAYHVLEDFDGKVDLILDAGPVELGVESTVLDLSTQPPMILRPGAITVGQLKPFIGEVVLGDEELLRRLPSTGYQHYSPRAEVILIEAGESAKIKLWLEQYYQSGKRVGLITRQSSFSAEPGTIVKVMPQKLEEYAQLIFAALRELDQAGVEAIIVEGVEESGLGITIMDRLRKAAQY